MTTSRRILGAVTAAGAAALFLSGCVAKSDVAAGAAFDVSSTDSECAVSSATAESGTLTFDVTNDSGQTSEFYLLADDGLRIVGEVENIAPSASRTLTVVAQPGTYFTLCKPGMIGEGVGKSEFTVTGDRVEVGGEDSEQKQQAVGLYAAFVKDQVGQLVPSVEDFVAAYETGDDEAARALFPQTRAFYERIEPVAEALGTLDPRIDYREVDAVAEGLDWTGFHRIEKDLWVPAEDALNADGETPARQDWAPSTTEERAGYGDQLLADVQELYDYVHSDDFTAALEDQGIGGISNGAIALLDEVATGKISGEEDWWSGTDLYDFAANVEGSKMAFSLVQDFAAAQGDDGAALVAEIEDGYAALEESLAAHGSLDEGFIGYSELTDADKREFTDLINALAEPLSQLTGTVLD
ncbi:iron uptake system protein EfeO [Microbacterium sp. APC 3901]|uniref:iron uptake system protein EfeO n=1 Tax=Microbacterium sp. APC 3901 TaxID=3035192 RepID=UPI0025B50618|nr:iron uptake system protein EfeO [Microbacterium sp. APC 3901]MDN3443341.1 EfeM/EfeO family lipoprotein [Microbacterium sp. APC 3901]